MQLAASMKLGDRYTLSECIAVGGMGEVWKAHDDVLKRTVAIKILGQQFLESAEFASRFQAEARHAASLAHPGVANVYDYGEDDERAYLVMEFVNGEPMSALLARTPIPPLTTTLSILAQTADAVAAAHDAGIVHRDVKPGNIIITPDGVAKVTDFGIARSVGSIPLTAHGQVIGTAQYMSPEQASGQHVGPASDIYSLGVVGYEALAGHRPFEEASPLALAFAHVNREPPALPEGVPREVRELIGRAMAKQPGARPPSAAAFASELRALQMRLTPPPPSARGASAPVTLVDAGSSPTRHMPAGGVVVAAPKLVIDERVVSPSKRRRRRIVPVVVAVAIVCLLLVALARRDAGRTLEPAGSSADASTTAAATTAVATTAVASAPVVTVATTASAPMIEIDRDAYIGRPFDAVRDELEALGFDVEQHKTKGKGHSDDTVIDVQPSGSVAPDSTITLTVGGDKDD